MADYDLVLYGATGFTGRRAAEYLAEHAGDSTWAIAGRDVDRLEQVAIETGAGGILVADSTDPASVDRMVGAARVVLTTAGPYAKYGTPVVEACVRHKVHYTDITGEPPWVRSLIDRFHDRAASDGTRIVPFCGFDSIPSDIGTLLAVDHLRRTTGQGAHSVTATFKMRAGLNGGTLDTALNLAEDPAMRGMNDPFLLNPPGQPSEQLVARSRDLRTVEYEPRRDVWLTPFVMAPFNSKVVRRSAALYAEWGQPYGDDFAYQEAMEMRSRAKATASLAGMAVLQGALKSRVGRALIRRLGPSPGEGPSEEKMNQGFFRVRVVAESESGEAVMTTMQRQGDPGNRITVPLLCESALHLANANDDELPGDGGGVLTPATGLGLSLVARLERAGFEISHQPMT